MEKIKEFQSKKIGTPDYINENCWLAKTLNYSTAKRCWYCELKFRHCPFFQYLIVSLILIFLSFTLSFLMEGEVLKSVIITVFTLVIVYGYFFTKSTEKIIEANFAQRKAKEALEEAKVVLEIKVKDRTKELEELTKGLEEQVKERTKELQEKMEESERFNRLAVDRELKMIKLKEEIKELKAEIEKIK